MKNLKKYGAAAAAGLVAATLIGGCGDTACVRRQHKIGADPI